jgi:hypothetical protein
MVTLVTGTIRPLGWAFFYLMVVLKIPIVLLGYIVWKAIHAVPEAEPEETPADGGGGTSHPREPKPRPPRRGPHGEPLPLPPQRVRARGRSLPKVR